jgi:predicted acetyltransferase
MKLREYVPDRDRDAVLRIYREVGWCSKPEHEEAFAGLVASGRTRVAEVDGSAECMVTTDPGSIRHGERDLSLAAVTGVTTSRVARKRGLAGRLTAHVLAEEAAGGSLVAMLGAFEQGYYNQLGFGNGGYEHWCTFDPSQLTVDVKPRVPVRLGLSDWKRMHANRLQRVRRHGACNIDSPELTRADMHWGENGFGLGYTDQDGNLTHHLWCSAKEAEHGPYSVFWTAYRSKDEFLELLGLLRSFEEQVRSVELREPPGIQLQDLLRKPFKSRQITRRSPHENRMTASAYWQMRILDLPGCLARTSLDAEPVRFNLTLSDPVERYLEDGSSWRGVAGDYVVEVGPACRAAAGREPSLPTLTASVNAFSRLWLGVRPASALAWTDELSGSVELLARLDRAFRLPSPSPDWEF